jgi:hypothetical protein
MTLKITQAVEIRTIKLRRQYSPSKMRKKTRLSL